MVEHPRAIEGAARELDPPQIAAWARLNPALDWLRYDD